MGWVVLGDACACVRACACAKHAKTTAYDVKRIIGQRMNEYAVREEARRFPFSVVEGEDQKPPTTTHRPPPPTTLFLSYVCFIYVLPHVFAY